MKSRYKISFFCLVSFFSILNLSFTTPELVDSAVSKETYINFTIDSTSYSFKGLFDPGCAFEYSCGKVKTVCSTTGVERNRSRVKMSFALLKDRALMSSYAINKKYEVTSNIHEDSAFCPLLFWIDYRPDIKSEFGYFSVENQNLDEQYIIYTKIEKANSEAYYLTGYFQCIVNNETETGEPKIMKGNFRARVCFERKE